jgi:glycine cleavage system aminomethyltransferase T
VVERVAARGHVNWTIARLAAAGPLPAPEANVLQDGKEVGRVTSAVRLPGGAGNAMLARIRRTAAEAGTPLAVAVGESTVEARVVTDPSPQS